MHLDARQLVHVLIHPPQKYLRFALGPLRRLGTYVAMYRDDWYLVVSSCPGAVDHMCLVTQHCKIWVSG